MLLKKLIVLNNKKGQKMKNKKAQGLSLNMVVIGAIALIVLVVILVIFIGGMNPLKKHMKHAPCSSLSSKNTQLKGYSCSWSPKCTGTNQEDYTAYVTPDDATTHTGQICCCKLTK